MAGRRVPERNLSSVVECYRMPWPDFGRGSGDRANYCKHFEHRLRSVLLSGKVDDMIQFFCEAAWQTFVYVCFFMAQLLEEKESPVGTADSVKCCGTCQGECECGNCSLLFSQCPVGFMLFRCSRIVES